MLCGTGRRVINPEVGHHLCGYGEIPNVGVHDDLAVTALYLADGPAGPDGRPTEALLLNFDLIGTLAPLNLRIRQAVAEATGVPAEQVFPTCTHTHNGPEVRERSFKWDRVPTFRPEYNDRLVAWAAEAARDAKASAEECTLLYNFAFAHHNMNRRFNFPDRRALYIPAHKQLIGQSYEYVDRELGVVAFRRKGTPNQYKAMITNYSAHPLAVGNTSNLVTADYQGCLRATVEETLAGCLCLATTGAAGDMHPMTPTSGFEAARAMGASLGALAVSRLYDAVAVDYDTRLRMAWGKIALRTRDEATSNLLPSRSAREDVPHISTQAREIETSYSLLGVGPILFVGVPGELVAELGAILKWSSPFLKTYILYLGTDCIAYIASRNQFLWGGYEARNTHVAAGEGERLVGEILSAAHAMLKDRPLVLPPRE